MLLNSMARKLACVILSFVACWVLGRFDARYLFSMLASTPLALTMEIARLLRSEVAWLMRFLVAQDVRFEAAPFDGAGCFDARLVTRSLIIRMLGRVNASLLGYLVASLLRYLIRHLVCLLQGR